MPEASLFFLLSLCLKLFGALRATEDILLSVDDSAVRRKLASS
jgi:hypothetical protein